MDQPLNQHVELFQVKFPLLQREEAIKELLKRFESRQSTNVCFVDMSAMNHMFKNPRLRSIYAHRALLLNDGAGMAFASWLQNRPFPDNLNGTDFCPDYLSRLPKGVPVYLLGSTPEVLAEVRKAFSQKLPHLNVVGTHHGYLDDKSERAVIDEIKALSPRIVLVGMGNPQQAEFIDRHLDHPELQGITWLAVGGFLDYYSGLRPRAPVWYRRNNLEWLYVVGLQPQKVVRYAWGIPKFLVMCLWAHVRNEHKIL